MFPLSSLRITYKLLSFDKCKKTFNYIQCTYNHFFFPIFFKSYRIKWHISQLQKNKWILKGLGVSLTTCGRTTCTWVVTRPRYMSPLWCSKWPTKAMSLSEKYFLNKFIFLAQNKCNLKPNDNLMFSLINVCMYTT